MKTKQSASLKSIGGRSILCLRGGRVGSTFKSIKDYNRKNAKSVRFE